MPDAVEGDPFDALRARLLAEVGGAIERTMTDPAAAVLGAERRSWAVLDCLLSLAAMGVVSLACQQEGLPAPMDPRMGTGVRAALVGLAGSFLNRIHPELLRLTQIVMPDRLGHA